MHSRAGKLWRTEPDQLLSLLIWQGMHLGTRVMRLYAVRFGIVMSSWGCRTNVARIKEQWKLICLLAHLMPSAK